MSGYLQRLLRNTMQPAESSIRPLLGSVFSPAEQGQASDSLPQEEHVEFAAQPEPLRPTQPFEQSVSTRRISRHDRQMLESSPDAEPVPNTSSLPPTETTKLLQPLLVEQVATRVPERHQQVNDLPRQEVPQQKHIFTPLMGERPARVSPSDAVANGLSTRHAAAPMKQEMNVSRPPGREPDEIQIHIGRIEVTAVQQAPARAATRPARKGQSLEEYLSRRDRRA